MKKHYLALATGILASVIALPSLANTAAISYQHMYRTHLRMHEDRLAMHYQFDKGLYLGIGLNLFNKKNDTFDDINNVSNYFDIRYRYRYNDKWTFTPSIRLKFYTDTDNDYDFDSDEISDNGDRGARYIPGLEVKYHFDKAFYAYGQYQYEIRKYANSKSDHPKTPSDHRQVYRLGAKYSFESGLGIAYEYTYYNATYTLADNKSTDYAQQLTVSYRFNHEWQPYVGVEDLAASTTSDTREARLTAGFNYYF
ncbi:oligogalacturonate-specific porin KdgM family protein [Celerinatantimonas sp. MCCC 1A17872]|uniref:oligogalacturonate-specific porin KdgM family protein n=1 Tax=Celerinatantimonas sp. MCCC 1A17872 TaxID=3177514 RepID=UPI0038C4CDBA